MRRLVLLPIALFLGCAGFENATLTTDAPLAHQDSATMNAPSPLASTLNAGYFYDAKTDISKWEASHANMTLGKQGGAMVLDMKGVGAEWEQLSRKFLPYDFSETPVVLVKARIEEGYKDSLKMRIDLVDEDGFSTNYVPQERYIRARKDCKLYKFVYAGNWVQNWPSRKDVNPKKIAEIKINFNGGGPNYNGKLIIEEILITDGKKKDMNPENYALFDFEDGAGGWWSANSIELGPDDSEGRDVMKLKLTECGPGWEGFGYKFSQGLNFSKTPVMVVRMKADKAGKLRIDLRDAKEYATNQYPLAIDFAASEEYQEVVFNFSGKFLQTWPNAQVVDSTTISSISCFVNPPENPAYTGKVLIDDITMMSLEEYNKSKK